MTMIVSHTAIPLPNKPVADNTDKPYLITTRQFFSSFRRETVNSPGVDFCKGMFWVHNREISAKDLAELCGQGYCAFPCVKRSEDGKNAGRFTTETKNITRSYFIFIDIESHDVEKIPPLTEKLLQLMPIPPTFAFESDSSGKPGKGNRAHLVWCFSDGMTEGTYNYLLGICRMSAFIGYDITKKGSFEDDPSICYSKMMYGTTNGKPVLSTTGYKEYTVEELMNSGLQPLLTPEQKMREKRSVTERAARKADLCYDDDARTLRSVIDRVCELQIDITGRVKNDDGSILYGPLNWFRIGCVICRLIPDNNEAESLFLKVSQFHPDYDEKEARGQWKDVVKACSKQNDGQRQECTVGTLVYLLNKNLNIF